MIQKNALHYQKENGGTIMFNYEITRVDENTVKYTTEDGSNVTLRFRKEDNPDIEDIITENLLSSYERRISENVLQQ